MSSPWIDWAVAGRPMYPGDPSGDAHLVEVTQETALLAALDGRGHGPEAAEASSKMIGLIRESPALPLDTLLRRGDEALQGTRGTAITLCRIERATRTMSWVAVGNVGGARIDRGARITRVPLTPGCCLAFHMGEPVAQQVALAAGDLLVFATDGIERDFAEKVQTALSVQEVADDVLRRCRKKTDDALVLVARLAFAPSPDTGMTPSP